MVDIEIHHLKARHMTANVEKEGTGNEWRILIDEYGHLQIDIVSMPAVQHETDDILVYGNTVKDGSGIDYCLLLDSDGHLQIDVLSMPSVAVTGTFWQATQPVSGTFWQATQPISAAALPLPSGAATSAIQTTMNTSLDAIEVDAAAIEVLLIAIDEDTNAIKLALQIIDDWDSSDRCKVEIDQVDAAYNPETDDDDIPLGEVRETINALLHGKDPTGNWERIQTNSSGAIKIYTP